MRTLQIRLPKKLLDDLQKLVDIGLYPSKSDAIRDGVRRLIARHSLLGQTNNRKKEKEKEIQVHYIH